MKYKTYKRLTLICRKINKCQEVIFKRNRKNKSISPVLLRTLGYLVISNELLEYIRINE